MVDMITFILGILIIGAQVIGLILGLLYLSRSPGRKRLINWLLLIFMLLLVRSLYKTAIPYILDSNSEAISIQVATMLLTYPVLLMELLVAVLLIRVIVEIAKSRQAGG